MRFPSQTPPFSLRGLQLVLGRGKQRHAGAISPPQKIIQCRRRAHEAIKGRGHDGGRVQLAGKGDAGDGIGVRGDGADGCPGGHVPHHDRLVKPGADQQRAAGAEGAGHDVVRVATQYAQRSPRLGFPHPHRSVVRSGGEVGVAGGPRHV